MLSMDSECLDDLLSKSFVCFDLSLQERGQNTILVKQKKCSKIDYFRVNTGMPDPAEPDIIES